MEYTVKQVSELVNLSKASIYNKLKVKKLQEHTTKKQGVTYIDEIGFKLIKNSLKVSIDDLKVFQKEDTISNLDDKIDSDTEDSIINKDYKNYSKVEIQYTVKQVSELVNLSKASIYNKLKVKKMQEHTTKKQGVTYIDEIGFKLIKNSLKVSIDDLKVFQKEDTISNLDDKIDSDTEDSIINKDYKNCSKIEIEYTIKQVSELVNLSKMSIYFKLKAKNMQEHITKKQGVTYIDDIGFNIIKNNLKTNIDYFEEHKKTNLEDLKVFQEDLKIIEEQDITNSITKEPQESRTKRQTYLDELRLSNEIDKENLQTNKLNNKYYNLKAKELEKRADELSSMSIKNNLKANIDDLKVIEKEDTISNLDDRINNDTEDFIKLKTKELQKIQESITKRQNYLDELKLSNEVEEKDFQSNKLNNKYYKPKKELEKPLKANIDDLKVIEKEDTTSNLDDKIDSDTEDSIIDKDYKNCSKVEKEYTIKQVSELVNLSKVSRYDNLETKELKGHITNKQGVSYIDESGFELIKNILKVNIDDLKVIEKEDTTSNLDDKIDSDTEDSISDKENRLKAEIEKSSNELKEKNSQLDNFENRYKKIKERKLQEQKDKEQDNIKALARHGFRNM
ncbi:MAG: hypothetical protein IMZ60_05270 [Actinobacteria bacterium]|nr:hypothetical protein [Actinomycetota bacterium]